jgi:hypothetical protein
MDKRLLYSWGFSKMISATVAEKVGKQFVILTLISVLQSSM